MRVVIRAGFISCFVFSFSFVIFCSGICVFVVIELIIVDAPKRPVKRGRSGWVVFELRVVAPSVAASVIIIRI